MVQDIEVYSWFNKCKECAGSVRVQEQEKQDQIMDKISTKEYENPFKGQAR